MEIDMNKNENENDNLIHSNGFNKIELSKFEKFKLLYMPISIKQNIFELFVRSFLTNSVR